MNILKASTEKRRIGNLGEWAAAWHLIKKGYFILKRNYVAADAEIDIIARRRGVIAFVEVKARNVKNLGKGEARPASAVTPEKQRKIIRASSFYLARHKPETRVRFDIIEVYLEDARLGVKIKEIKHIENAFDKDTAYKRR